MMKDADVADRQFVTALARGFAILECFTPHTPELGSSDIAKMIGLPQPTIWRLCHTLLALGYLEQVPGSTRLRSGLRVLALGYAALGNFPLAELARPAMQALAERFEGAVSLGTRQGNDIIYVQRCQGSAIVFSNLGVGSRVSISVTPSGWAFLASIAERERKTLMTALEAEDPARWRRNLGRLRKAIGHYEKKGFIAEKGLLHPEINSAAVAFRLPGRAEPFTLSSGGIASRFDDAKLKAIGEALKDLAASLSRAVPSA